MAPNAAFSACAPPPCASRRPPKKHVRVWQKSASHSMKIHSIKFNGQRKFRRRHNFNGQHERRGAPRRTASTKRIRQKLRQVSMRSNPSQVMKIAGERNAPLKHPPLLIYCESLQSSAASPEAFVTLNLKIRVSSVLSPGKTASGPSAGHRPQMRARLSASRRKRDAESLRRRRDPLSR